MIGQTLLPLIATTMTNGTCWHESELIVKPKWVSNKKANVDRFALIEAALRTKTKVDLVELLMATAMHHDDVNI